MPFIDLKIAGAVPAEKKESVKAALGRAIPALHKTEAYLMVGIADNYDLWMGGRRLERGAYAAVSLFGSAAPADCEEMTARVCRILDEELGIPGEAVYVTYHPVRDWGWNGSNF